MNKQCKFLILALIFIGCLIPCVIAVTTNYTLINDGIDWIFNTLSEFSEGHLYWGCNFSHRARKIVLILQVLPVNIAYFLFKVTSFKALASIFSGTLLILPAILCFYSVWLFYRAKKFYFSFIPILELCAVIFPTSQYGVPESYIAVFLFFILFQYFILNIELKMFDKIFIIFLCLSLYYSHETIIFFAPLMWICYFKYTDKNNKLLKFCIFNSVLAFISIFIYAFTPIGPNILESNSTFSILSFLYPPLFWKSDFGLILNFHAIYYLVFALLFLLTLCIKNLKFHIFLNSAILLMFIFIKINYYTYVFFMYRYMSVYIMLVFMLLMIIFLKKENYIKSVSVMCLPLIFITLIINNIYITKFANEYTEFNKKLAAASEKGYLYYSEDIEFFTEAKLHEYLLPAHLEQLSYSLFAVNSIKPENITKGLILGFDKDFYPINYCKGHLQVKGGSLWILPVTKYWDLTPYIKYFHESCEGII